MTVSPTRIASGTRIDISGDYFQDGCADVNDARATPRRDIPIRLVDPGSRYDLGTLDADGQLRISGSFVVPGGVTPGMGYIEAGDPGTGGWYARVAVRITS